MTRLCVTALALSRSLRAITRDRNMLHAQPGLLFEYLVKTQVLC